MLVYFNQMSQKSFFISFTGFVIYGKVYVATLFQTPSKIKRRHEKYE